MSTLGSGIQKNSARPIRIHVGEDGDYWLCDANVESGSNPAEAGCTAHSSVPMAEGG